jgi:hypothetical protein
LRMTPQPNSWLSHAAETKKTKNQSEKTKQSTQHHAHALHPPTPTPTGATLTSKEKLDIARNLAKLGVDIIEAGFPIASPDDLEAVRQIAKHVGNEVFPDGTVVTLGGLSLPGCHSRVVTPGGVRLFTWTIPAAINSRACVDTS